MRTIKFFLLPLLALALFACDPNGIDPHTEEPDRQTVAEITQAEAAFSGAISLAEIAIEDAGVFKTSQICATITLDSALREIVVDFGTGCTGPDGIHRSGKFTINYIGRHRQPGSQFSIAFDQFTVDGDQLNGTLAITNFAFNANNQLFFTTSVTNGLVVNAQNDSVGYDGTRTFTWVAGANTPFNISDDEYEVTGNATGFNSLGRSYALTVNQALLFKQRCAQQGIDWPVSGEIEISSSEYVGTLKVEYGAGTCDYDATLIWRGRQYPFSR